MYSKIIVLAAMMLSTGLSATGIALEVKNEETWYVVNISGSSVGFASEIVTPDGDDVVFRTHMNLSMSRMGTAMKMFVMVEEIVDANGRFKTARMEMDASAIGVTAKFVLIDDTIESTFSSGGSDTRRSIPWEKGAVTQWQAATLIEEWLTGSETELEFKMFNATDGTFKPMRYVRDASIEEEVDGRLQMLRTVASFEDDVQVGTTWFDEAGKTYRNVMQQMGMEIVIRRVTEAEMAAIDIDPNFDIIRKSMIACTGYPDPPSSVENVTLHLQMKSAIPADRDFSAPNQREVARGDDWVDLMITREPVLEIGITDEERETYLSSDHYIQSDHPSIVGVADSIKAANSGDDLALARSFSNWVAHYITQKNYEQGFASALETLKTKSGDCTEHSLLLSALFRAAGIPARPTVGLAYFDGQLIGHMWTEAFADGQWRTFDALDLETNPIRIRIMTATDGQAVNERALLKAYSFVGGMTVDVSDFTPLKAR